ncbi:MAG: hypothetical protein M1823_001238 [Watsoniomyces obsoletus]|nr:MAG: hypothetical protein M1823_001238 [Watsoniomyces obsoletus]
MIDHSLLHPTLSDSEIASGLQLCKTLDVATACIKPYSLPLAASSLQNTSVGICPVIGFPHGNSTVSSKVFEARECVEGGAAEVDMVVNIGKVLSEEWEYVEDEIRAINEAVTTAAIGGNSTTQGGKQEGKGAILKVIFEIGYLQDSHIRKLCDICVRQKVGFIKTSTGYGFVKGEDGRFEAKGANVSALKLMRECVGDESGVQVKAAGGVRTLDDLLVVMALGVTRVGATATKNILEEAERRGVGKEEVEVEVPKGKDGELRELGGGGGGAKGY